MIKKIFKGVIILLLVAVVLVAAINIYVVSYSKSKILSVEAASALTEANGEASCIVVLGASVKNGTPSPILANRLDTGLELFNRGVSNIILLTGDNGRVEYNEVQGMKDYMLENGADVGLTKNNIYLDYAGFSTYESMYRCKHIFGAEKIIVSTQDYHLYRTLFIANKLGIEAYGVAAEDRPTGQLMRDIREIPARVKDFFLVLIKFEPRIMGEEISLTYPSTQHE